MPSFLSPTQQAKLAKALDKKINIPLLSDRREKDIFLKVVREIDRQMERLIPDEILGALNSGSVQVEDIVSSALKDNLVPLLSDLISFPFLPRKIRDKILDFVVETLVDAMASATTIDEVIEKFLNEEL